MPSKVKQRRVYCVLMIGAGNIAAGFDEPASKYPLTHAHAFSLHPKTKLVGICDIDLRKAKRASRRWSCEAFGSVAEACRAVQPDIVSVCTPDRDHHRTLLSLIPFHPKLVICEKPLTRDAAHGARVMRAYAKARIPLLVSSRRYDTSIQRLRQELRRGRYGKVIAASAIYVGGVLHNGFYAVDLARYLFGEVISTRALHAVRDVSGPDKTVAAFVTLRHCPQYFMIAGNGKAYYQFELDIVCEKRRIRLSDGGHPLSEQRVRRHALYPSYRVLGTPLVRRTQTEWSLLRMVENAVNHLTRKEPLVCDARDAYLTQRVCNALLRRSP